MPHAARNLGLHRPCDAIPSTNPAITTNQPTNHSPLQRVSERDKQKFWLALHGNDLDALRTLVAQSPGLLRVDYGHHNVRFHSPTTQWLPCSASGA